MANKISYKFNLDTNTWSTTPFDDGKKIGDSWIAIGFEQNAGYPIKLNNVKYGYIFSEVIPAEGRWIPLVEASFPPENVKLESTYEEWLTPFTILPSLNDRDYHLMVWASVNENYVNTEYSFRTPREEQPFNSWTYDSDKKIYVPPIPRPETEGVHIWDEQEKQWDTGRVKVVGPYLYNEETKSWDASPDYELS
tara:strand:+ start:702 stop:1283 length:582 start_codon:yes stop_codon:yes gene_type:complete